MIHLIMPTYRKEPTHICALVNFLDHQNTTYIGQTGMYRRKVADRRKTWIDLERAPLQRMQEHITAVLSQNTPIGRRPPPYTNI